MSGDRLAILLFAWTLAVTFWLEGRKEVGWRKVIFWGTATIALLAGPLWPRFSLWWPAGATSGQQIATNPESWFFLFMTIMTIVAVTGRLNTARAQIDPRDGAAKDAVEGATHNVNWAPWNARSQYTLEEFAKMLAKTDPASAKLSSDGQSYLRLLIEEATSGKLPCLPTYAKDVWGNPMLVPPNHTTSVQREVALGWAHCKKFPADHLR